MHFVKNNNKGYSLYFIIFFIFGNLILMNMLIGILSNKFFEIKKQKSNINNPVKINYIN